MCFQVLVGRWRALRNIWFESPLKGLPVPFIQTFFMLLLTDCNAFDSLCLARSNLNAIRRYCSLESMYRIHVEIKWIVVTFRCFMGLFSSFEWENSMEQNGLYFSSFLNFVWCNEDRPLSWAFHGQHWRPKGNLFAFNLEKRIQNIFSSKK